MTAYTTRADLVNSVSATMPTNSSNSVDTADIRESIAHAFDSAAIGTQVGRTFATLQTGFTPPAAAGGKWRVVKDVDFQNGLTMTSQDYVIFANCQISGASTFTTCDNVHFFQCCIEASLTLSACENCTFINCEEDQAGRITTTSVMNDGIESTTASSTTSDQVKTSTTPLLVAHAPFASDRGTVGYAENKISAGQWAEPWGRIYHSQRYDGDPHYGTWLLPWLTQRAGEPYITVEPGVELHLRYVCILNSRGPGIYVKAGGRLILDHCYISHCQGTGIYCEDGSNVLVMRSVIEHNGTSSAHSQIRGAGKQSTYRDRWDQTVIVQSHIVNGWSGELAVTGGGTSHRCFINTMRTSTTGNWDFVRPSFLTHNYTLWYNHADNADVTNSGGAYFEAHQASAWDESDGDTGWDSVDTAAERYFVWPASANSSRGAWDYSSGDTYTNTLASVNWLNRRFGQDGDETTNGTNTPSHFGGGNTLFPQGYGWIFPEEEAWESDLLQSYPLEVDSWATAETTLTRTRTGARWVVEERDFHITQADATTDAMQFWGGSDVLFKNCRFQDLTSFHNFADITFVGCSDTTGTNLSCTAANGNNGYFYDHYENGTRQTDAAVS